MEVIVALDAPNLALNEAVVADLEGLAGWYKVGMRLFYGHGRDALTAVRRAGARLFLDLKLHDIPHTVGTAVESLEWAAPDLLTVHASGGSAMIEAARGTVERLGLPTRIVAVTVLTSLSEAELHQIGWHGDTVSTAERLARLAVDAGAHGVVCSAHEASAMRRVVGVDGVVVTPGIRLPGDAAGDQTRVALPSDAAAWGASHAVIGRPILAAADRRAKWQQLQQNLRSARS